MSSYYCEGCDLYDHCICSEYYDDEYYDYDSLDDTYPCGCCTCCGCLCDILGEEEEDD